MFNKQNKEVTKNKYDQLTKMFYLIFGVGALIIYVCVGLTSDGGWQVWLLGIIAAICGAAAWGTLAYFIISLVRKDKPKTNKYDLISRAIYILFFIVATIAFVAIGFQYGQTKTWIIAFIGAYGAATVYGTVAKLIITLIRKDK